MSAPSPKKPTGAEVFAPTTETIERERSLLSGMMHESRKIAEVLGLIGPADLISALHCEVFSAIVAVYESTPPSTEYIPVVAILDHLTSHKKLAIFDDGKSTPLQIIEGIWSQEVNGAYCPYHAGKIRELSIRKSIYHMGAHLMREAAEPSQSPDELLATAQQTICTIGSVKNTGLVVKLDQALMEAMAELDRRRDGEMSGIPTGLADIDGFMDGLQAGELILIGARPSVGKTAFGANIARNAAGCGVPVMFFSIEQKTKELAFRLLSGESNVNSLTIRRGRRMTPHDAQQLIDAKDRLSPLPMWFNDCSHQTARTLYATSRRMKTSVNIGMIVIDYVQLVSGIGSRQRNEELSEISRAMKNMAREFEIPVVALAQLNRKSEDRDEPKLSDLKDCGALEQDADVVILLHRLEAPDENASVELIQARIAKQRNGPVGPTVLAYRKASMRFENYSKGIPV